MDRDRHRDVPRKTAAARFTKEDSRSHPDALACYLRELRAGPSLTRNEEHAVAMRARDGDPDARDLLVRANLRFVVNEAKRWQGRGRSLEDLIADGNLGLLGAADKFDPARDVKFITFAVWSIRAEIQRGFRRNRLIAGGNAVRDHGPLVQRTRTLLFAKIQREPTAAEIAQVIEIPARTVGDILRALEPIASLDAERGADGGRFVDSLSDGDADAADAVTMDRELTRQVDAALALLPERDAQIVRLYFGLTDDGRTWTLEEIGALLSISRERARQLRDRALSRIRTANKLSA